MPIILLELIAVGCQHLSDYATKASSMTDALSGKVQFLKPPAHRPRLPAPSNPRNFRGSGVSKTRIDEIQSDMRLKDMCQPRQEKLIVALLAAHFYRILDDKYVFRLNELGLDRVCTAAFAVELARKAGGRRFKMFAFNAVTQNNFEYAQCIGGRPADTQSWHRHKAVIEQAAADATVDWVLI